MEEMLFFFSLKILQLCSVSRLDNLCLVSKWCALWKLEEAPGTVSEVHRDLSPYLECLGALPSAGRKNFHLKMREMRILCEGQFIIIWTPAGRQDWTLNKLRQDICSKLASLTALHKQESAGVRHVERLPNRVINLCKQKNLPNKHISSHRTPG